MSDSGSEKPLPQPLDTAAALGEAIALLPEGAPAVLIAGLALAYYGIERYTKDVDLALSQAHTSRVATMWPDKQPVPLRIGGVSLRMNNGVRADFIDRRFDFAPLFAALLENAQKRKLTAVTAGQRVLVAPLPYLVALKLAADRPQDKADLLRLLALSQLDYVEARAVVAEHLGAYAAQRLDKLARVAGRSDAPKDYSHEPS